MHCHNRRVRFLGRRLALIVLGCGLAVGGVAPAATGSHGDAVWAGKWLTSTGTLRLSVPSQKQLAALAADPDADVLWDRLSCKKGPQFYVGTYGTGQGDSGRVVACGTKSTLFARFLSTGRFKGSAGSFSVSIAPGAALAFAGRFTQDAGGSGPYTGRWELHFRGDSEHARASAAGGHEYTGPFEVRMRFHAQNLLTAPPSDAGDCTPALKPAIVTGEIVARRTDGGEIQGGGDVDAAPHLARCRVPTINVRVDDVTLTVITPGKRLRAEIDVHIDGEAVHRPGDCKVNTRGTITAVYDDTVTAANGLRSHELVIGPWRGSCVAHLHTITNSITSITANAASSTWIRVNVLCPGDGTGLSPRNCV